MEIVGQQQAKGRVDRPASACGPRGRTGSAADGKCRIAQPMLDVANCRRRDKTGIAIWFVIVLLYPFNQASAWENDFHYGLTKWLAVEAGFSEVDAKLISSGTLNQDLGSNTATHSVFWYSCLGRDPQASMRIRDWHFPSFSEIPGSPKSRSVEPGSDAALRESLKEIESKAPVKEAYGLFKLGEALHPLQDSWSHSGEPDTPPWPCDKDLAWGHPIKKDTIGATRGGYKSHDNDLTYLWPRDAASAAKATFQVLTAYLRERGKSPGKTFWKDIEASVHEFSQQGTKQGKKEWFRQKGFSNLDFLDDISLPEDDEDNMVRLGTTGRRFAASLVLTAQHSEKMGNSIKPLTSSKESPSNITDESALDVRTFFRKFFEAWVTSNNYTDAAQFIDRKVFRGLSVQQELGTDDVYKEAREESQLKSALWIWRLRDHGLASYLGHGVMTGNTGIDKQLSIVLDSAEKLTNYKTLSEALIPLCEEEDQFLIMPFPRSGTNSLVPSMSTSYAAIARFRNAPHDMVMVVAGKVSGLWKVLSITWAVDP